MTGIYKITSPSGRVYIGQARNIEKRMRQYMNLSCKKQIKLYNSLKKYGADNHIFEIEHTFGLDVSREVLTEYEQHYYDFYNYKDYNLLNLKRPGVGGTFSKETKTRISKSKGKPITQFNCEGKVIKHYNSIQQAALLLKTTVGIITYSLSTGNYCEYGYFRLGKIKKELIIDGVNNIITQYDKFGKILNVWKTIKEAEDSIIEQIGTLEFSSKFTKRRVALILAKP